MLCLSFIDFFPVDSLSVSVPLCVCVLGGRVSGVGFLLTFPLSFNILLSVIEVVLI